jgi:hypothetical protein
VRVEVEVSAVWLVATVVVVSDCVTVLGLTTSVDCVVVAAAVAVVRTETTVVEADDCVLVWVCVFWVTVDVTVTNDSGMVRHPQALDNALGA